MNWEQFRAILWLRWRLSRNQFLRGNRAGVVIATLAGGILALIGIGAFLGTVLLGALALKKAPANGLMFVWDAVAFGVLFFSFASVMAELQRSESVDLTRLLHLPIGLKQVFVFNYIASLVSFGSILAVTVVTGLATGLVISHGSIFLLAVPLGLGFVFMVTAWIYCLRGWLLSLMVNPRRRRTIIMWVTIGFVLISQSPQLINIAIQRRAARHAKGKSDNGKEHSSGQQATDALEKKVGPALDVIVRAHSFVPVLWLPNGVRGLATGGVLPALWGSVGMFALGWWGLSRAYRSTLKFYRAEESIKPGAVKSISTVPEKPVGNWVERKLPWLPEDTGAVVMAQLRSMTRAPEVRTMLAMGLFMSILLPAIMLARTGINPNFPAAAKPFVSTGATVFVLFCLMQLVCNQFGCDRDAFRAFVLLPTSRTRLLLGKNLALFPLAAAITFLPLAAATILVHLPVLVVLATIFQFVAAFIVYCTIGNLSSILLPFRIASGSLKPSKQSWQVALGMFALMMIFPFAISPIFIPPFLGMLAGLAGWPAGLVQALSALGLAVVAILLYALTLQPMGRLLQRRETKILRAVTEVVE